MSVLALISLGSNLGDRKSYLDFAVAAFSTIPDTVVRKVSIYRETPPVGGPDNQDSFLNAGAVLETTLQPEMLLDYLNAIETAAGRMRTDKWGARTLDLDIILFGDLITDTPRLNVPHPQLPFRRFVLAPLAEIAPETVDPYSGKTIRQLLENLDRRPSYLVIGVRWQRAARQAIFKEIVRRLNAVPVADFAGVRSASWQARSPTLKLARRSALLNIAARGELSHSISRGERWIVSNFTMQESISELAASYRNDPEKMLALLRLYRDTEQRALQPTFEAQTFPLLPRYPGPKYSFAWPPRLTVDLWNIAVAVDEIFTTCAATRAGR
jgi:2-amino-4-hydroxy-6-hydroxymethyldihydropteridine diphosphokinase